MYGPPYCGRTELDGADNGNMRPISASSSTVAMILRIGSAVNKNPYKNPVFMDGEERVQVL
jgi:hypothetical protein